jgi:hypothetical protein
VEGRELGQECGLGEKEGAMEARYEARRKDGRDRAWQHALDMLASPLRVESVVVRLVARTALGGTAALESCSEYIGVVGGPGTRNSSGVA